MLREVGDSELSELSSDSLFAGDSSSRAMEGRDKVLIVDDSAGLPVASFVLVFAVMSSQKAIGEATLKLIRNKTQRVTGKKGTMERIVEKMQC